jgi:molybdopterin converting factor small subunit
MPLVRFTANLQRHILCPSREVDGTTVAEALRSVFVDCPRLRGYIVDEHDALRRHMMVFVDGRQISDREGLSDPVQATSEIFIAQALSGGS